MSFPTHLCNLWSNLLSIKTAFLHWKVCPSHSLMLESLPPSRFDNGTLPKSLTNPSTSRAPLLASSLVPILEDSCLQELPQPPYSHRFNLNPMFTYHKLSHLAMIKSFFIIFTMMYSFLPWLSLCLCVCVSEQNNSKTTTWIITKIDRMTGRGEHSCWWAVLQAHWMPHSICHSKTMSIVKSRNSLREECVWYQVYDKNIWKLSLLKH